MATKFKARTKHIPLEFLGEAWAGAYLEARFVTIPDSRLITQRLTEVGDDDNRAIEESLTVVKQQFIAGKAPGEDGALVDLTADDLEDAFDADAIIAIYTRVLGNPDPKVSKTSTTTTPVEDMSQPSA